MLNATCIADDSGGGCETLGGGAPEVLRSAAEGVESGAVLFVELVGEEADWIELLFSGEKVVDAGIGLL